MVTNLLSPYSSTLAMQAQSDSSGCGNFIVSKFIRTIRPLSRRLSKTAPASSPGPVHHPKMGARRYTLPRVFELLTDSNSGPAGPIAVNAPAAKMLGFGTSRGSKGTLTVHHSHGRMSPSSAGVTGKPRTQRPGKSADEATKDKGKYNKSRSTPLYQPVRRELLCNSDSLESDSEGVRSAIS
jgi:hypothetical protein